MAITKTSRSVTTSGDAWTDLSPGGEVVVVLVGVNAGAADTKIAVRLLKAGNSPVLIVPGDTLPAGQSYRLRIPWLHVAAGDKLQVASIASVAWSAAGGQMPNTKYVTRAAATSGGTWTDLVTVAGEVSSIIGANKSAGIGTAMIRMTMGGVTTVLVPGDEVREGGSVRLVQPIVLAAGDKIQVASYGAFDWIANEVNAA